MLTVESIRFGPYEAAAPPPVQHFTFGEVLNLCVNILFDFAKVIVLSVPILIKSIKEIFLGRKTKIVRGWTALVTGGAHGIGRAIARELSKQGCNVAIADVDGEGAKAAAKELQEEFKVNAVGYELDVVNYKLLPKLKKDIENDIGTVDILVNNAGIMPVLTLLSGSSEDVERFAAINITSHFHTVRMFLGDMVNKRRGHIVTISSMAALHPIGRGVIYTASKCAVAGFARALEQELRMEGLGEGINFTTVFPYFVSTRKDLMSRLKLRIPAITPEETGLRTVKAVLQNDRIVYVPSHMSVGLRIFSMLPYSLQNLIRDHIYKEQEAIINKEQDNYVST